MDTLSKGMDKDDHPNLIDGDYRLDTNIKIIKQMLSKEEILDNDICEQWCEGDTVPQCRGWLLETMADFAKQESRREAIEFKKWVDLRNRFLLDEIGKLPTFIDYKTDEELYEQYIIHKQNNQ